MEATNTPGGKHTEEFSKTLTEEQRITPSYLDWDDATLAGAVRALAKDLFETDVDGFKGVPTIACAIVLCSYVEQTKADKIDAKLKKGGIKYSIVVRELKPKNKNSEAS